MATVMPSMVAPVGIAKPKFVQSRYSDGVTAAPITAVAQLSSDAPAFDGLDHATEPIVLSDTIVPGTVAEVVVI